MQDAPHRTFEEFEELLKFCVTRVLGLGFPKFANGGLECTHCKPYSPNSNAVDFLFFWGYVKDRCYASSSKTRLEFCTTSYGGHLGIIVH